MGACQRPHAELGVGPRHPEMWACRWLDANPLYHLPWLFPPTPAHSWQWFEGGGRATAEGKSKGGEGSVNLPQGWGPCPAEVRGQLALPRAKTSQPPPTVGRPTPALGACGEPRGSGGSCRGAAGICCSCSL